MNWKGRKGKRNGMNWKGRRGKRNGMNWKGRKGKRNGMNWKGRKGKRNGMNWKGREGKINGMNWKGSKGKRNGMKKKEGGGEEYWRVRVHLYSINRVGSATHDCPNYLLHTIIPVHLPPLSLFLPNFSNLRVNLSTSNFLYNIFSKQPSIFLKYL